MTWSEAQLAAIATYDKNLLVAAAAGSGKTSVLVERIIRRILDETQDFQINEVLVVTFTNAAAAEMRERIYQAIEQALKENPGSRHLERQLILLNAASISTLHAFCQNVIKENFHLLDLDPKFRLATPQETDMLKRDVLENLFESYYEKGDEDFLAFVEQGGNERGDESLYEMILKLYEFSCSQPFPAAWLRRLPEKFSVPKEQTLDGLDWAEIVKSEARLLLLECADKSEQLIAAAESAGFDFYVPVFTADKEIFDHLLAGLSGGWDQFRQAVFAVKFAVLRAPKGTDEAQKEFFSKKRGAIKDCLKKIKESYFNVPAQELLDGLTEAKPSMEMLCRLAESFGEEFQKVKRSKALVDFNDLEHFCLEVLADRDAPEGELRPSPAAQALREKYREVMVDEYQDTNGVQEAILSLLYRKDAANLFLVGDVKQSIYRFRLAEPELFMEKYRRYPRAGELFARIDLKQNFRSRGGVLAAINFIFAQLMRPEIAELSYGEAERLYPGADYPQSGQRVLDDAVEIDIIDRGDGEAEGQDGEELRGFALESSYIAGRIQTFMEGAPAIFDKQQKSYRPVKWSDIVILLRSVKNKADLLLEALRARNIPAHASVASGYFQEIEVQVMLALLQIIDNPRQDIALASVLHSPIVGLSAEELARIRLLSDDDVFFKALLKAAAVDAELPEATKEKVVRFVVDINRWRGLARQKSVPELIWQLYRDTSYYDYVGGMPGGAARQANLRLLYDRAREYESTSFRGLFRFLRFVEKMQGAGTDLSVAGSLGENENVVRIMSIHKSKGLEFPIVIVADLGKKFNMLDSKAPVLIHKRLGLGPYVVDSGLRVKYPTIARQAIACQVDRESKAEELRVLYVALTRAREKLILVGSARCLKDKAGDWSRYAASSEALLPAHVIAGADSYLDWLGTAVARHGDGEALRLYGGYAGGRVNPDVADSSKWSLTIVTPGQVHSRAARAPEKTGLLESIFRGEPLPPSEDAAAVEKKLSWQYPQRAAQAALAKISVTEMKRRFDVLGQEDFKEEAVFARPRFISGKTSLTGAEYGTLLHCVMQHLSLARVAGEAELRAQLAEMADREILTAEQAAKVDVAAVCRYFQSSIGRRMLASKHVRRELPFSVLLPAQRFYPELEDEEERIFVQGIIDVLFDEGEEMVLIDYKTDSGSARELTEKYKVQVDLYAEAVEKIFQKKVKERYLYSFGSGQWIMIESGEA